VTLSVRRVLPWVLVALVCAMPLAAPASAGAASTSGVHAIAAATKPCTDVLVLGARGSGQPAAGSSSDGSTGLGPQVFSLYQRIVADQAARDIAEVSLTYPARPAEELIVDPATYFSGLERGVTNAKRFLARQSAACPSQRFVLAGYSQGAMVMHRVMQDLTASSDPTSARLLRRIDGVALLADGDRLSSDRVTAIGTASGGRGISYALPKDAQVRGTLLPARLMARVFSVCEQGDVVCDYHSLLQSNASGVNGTSVHVTSYTGSPDVLRVADAIAARLR